MASGTGCREGGQHADPLAAGRCPHAAFRSGDPAGDRLAVEVPDRHRLPDPGRLGAHNHGPKIIFSGVSDPAALELASRLLGPRKSARWRRPPISPETVAASTSRHPGAPGACGRPTAGRSLRRSAPPRTLRAAHLHARPYHRDRRLAAMSRHGKGRPAWLGGSASYRLSIIGWPTPDLCRRLTIRYRHVCISRRAWD